jgi:AAA domain
MSFRTYTRSEIKKLPQPKWLMKWMIAEGSLGRLLAAPNKGKSFMVLDWACHLALGWDWYGYKVKKECVVLYVAAEGLPIRRMEAWEAHYGEVIPDTLIVRDGMNIGDGDDFEAIKDDIEKYDADVLIIDTQQRAGFEEGADAAGDSINALDDIRATFSHLAVVLVHHPGHANTGRGRGFSGYFGALDYEFVIDAEDPRELMTLERTKQRDDGYFVPRSFYLKQVVLGEDEDGDEISSCVMLEADPALLGMDDKEKILHALRLAAEEEVELGKSQIAGKAGIARDHATAALSVLESEGKIRFLKRGGTGGRSKAVVELV